MKIFFSFIILLISGSSIVAQNMPVYESVYRLQKGFKNNDKINYQLNIYNTGHAMYEDNKTELRKEFLNDLLNWLQKVTGEMIESLRDFCL